MSGPHGEGLHLPPYGSRRHGLMTIEAIEESIRYVSGSRTFQVLVEHYPSGQFDAAVLPAGRLVAEWRGEGLVAPQNVVGLRRTVEALLRGAGWEVTGCWACIEGAHLALVARITPSVPRRVEEGQ